MALYDQGTVDDATTVHALWRPGPTPVMFPGSSLGLRKVLMSSASQPFQGRMPSLFAEYSAQAPVVVLISL